MRAAEAMPICPSCLTSYPDGSTTCEHDGAVLVPDSALSVDQTLPTGTKVGEYVIETQIGSGTFGDVYRAIQPLIGKQVAVKVLSRKYSADPHVVSRFIAEARAVNQIRNKNIIDIFSFGQLPDGRHYHVMELLDGEPLDTYVARRGGRLALEELLPILRGLARALDAAHAAGIAHRDLKPANVFLARDEDGTPFPKLLDFGIAKLLNEEMPRQHHTATGAAVGTPDYMSPEQCQGPDVDHRTDIYSFGVMTYQLVTGHLPFKGGNVVEVLMKQMTAEPTPPSAVGPHVPAELDAPILAMMAKVPEERPANLTLAVQGLTDAAILAGFDVPSSSFSGDMDPRLVRSGPGVTPPHVTPLEGSPALAATLPSASNEDLRAPPVPDAPKRTGSLWIGIAVMVVAVASVPFVLDRMGQSNTGPADAGAARTAKAPPPKAPPATPVPPARVQVFLPGAPADAVVVGADGEPLGLALGGVSLPQGAAPVQLRLRAAGHEELALTIAPTETTTVVVEMKKLKRPTSARRPPKDKGKGRDDDKPGRDELEVPDFLK
ncbi:MAG: serine/threonine protein kinase [Deltaproteobacteria bacterium]|nr:serine/threonine protein kinase [Deltaproteobacteria bacterium]